MEKTIYFLVTGRVQGVNFRAATRDRALASGVTGWVRNRPDGAVEGNATAAKEVLDEFIAWLRHGPRVAFVEDLRIEAIETKVFSGFEIRRTG
ncbi:MAG TPA: acylphosphatase [Gammaproteobacteria bacterium]|nr:acylphosphatase [Gammaproteobacteria bacterium]